MTNKYFILFGAILILFFLFGCITQQQVDQRFQACHDKNGVMSGNYTCIINTNSYGFTTAEGKEVLVSSSYSSSSGSSNSSFFNGWLFGTLMSGGSSSHTTINNYGVGGNDTGSDYSDYSDTTDMTSDYGDSTDMTGSWDSDTTDMTDSWGDYSDTTDMTSSDYGGGDYSDFSSD